MTFLKRIALEGDEIWAGTVLRFPLQEPFEDTVDFMLFFVVGPSVTASTRRCSK